MVKFMGICFSYEIDQCKRILVEQEGDQQGGFDWDENPICLIASFPGQRGVYSGSKINPQVNSPLISIYPQRSGVSGRPLLFVCFSKASSLNEILLYH
jgi:hypothetical protein